MNENKVYLLLGLLICLQSCAHPMVMQSRTKMSMQHQGDILVSNSETVLDDIRVEKNKAGITYPYLIFIQNESLKSSYEINLTKISAKLSKGDALVTCERESRNGLKEMKLPPKTAFTLSCKIFIERGNDSSSSRSDVTGTLKIPVTNLESTTKNLDFDFEVFVLGKDFT